VVSEAEFIDKQVIILLRFLLLNIHNSFQFWKRGVDMSSTSVEVNIESRDRGRPLIPVGWGLVENESIEEEPDGMVTLEEVTILKDGESYVNGEKMLQRAIESGNRAGLRSARALIRQQHLIPAEWQERRLVLAGVVVRRPLGARYVAYLYWSGSQWRLNWEWLGNQLGPNYRSVRSCGTP